MYECYKIHVPVLQKFNNHLTQLNLINNANLSIEAQAQRDLGWPSIGRVHFVQCLIFF